VWDGQDLIDMIGPLWGEADEAKRIAGWKAVDKFIAEEGLVIPLLQYVQPIIARKTVKVIPEANGMLKAQNLSPA
jgi:peptide/nickel transport system substrate-binding protein